MSTPTQIWHTKEIFGPHMLHQTPDPLTRMVIDVEVLFEIFTLEQVWSKLGQVLGSYAAASFGRPFWANTCTTFVPNLLQLALAAPTPLFLFCTNFHCSNHFQDHARSRAASWHISKSVSTLFEATARRFLRNRRILPSLGCGFA